MDNVKFYEFGRGAYCEGSLVFSFVELSFEMGLAYREF